MAMKCPVCGKIYENQVRICTVCRFTEISKEFLSREDYQEWMKNVVKPFREMYQKECDEKEKIQKVGQISRNVRNIGNEPRERQVQKRNFESHDVITGVAAVDNDNYNSVTNCLAKWKIIDSIANWKDIVSVAGGSLSYGKIGVYTVGLRKDGTVAMIDDGLSSFAIKNNTYWQGVQYWKNIISIVCGTSIIVGLRSDGTVVVATDDPLYRSYTNYDIENWRNIVSVVIGGKTDTYDRMDYILGLRQDGTVVVADNCGNRYRRWYNQVTRWRNIVSIVCVEKHIVGLKNNGEIESVSYETKNPIIKNLIFGGTRKKWSGIVSIGCTTSPHSSTIVGLKKDGTVVTNNDSQYNVKDWRNIIFIDCGYSHIVGLKMDGTVVAIGTQDQGQCNVQGWTDIVSIVCDKFETIGLKKDGTLVRTGDYYDSYDDSCYYRRQSQLLKKQEICMLS